jgi:1-aminocyclopropane-1-carboxylate deaminase/D-cysteine desulfhydrase-like pyridoxal-dependent ACC family enzyme
MYILVELTTFGGYQDSDVQVTSRVAENLSTSLVFVLKAHRNVVRGNPSPFRILMDCVREVNEWQENGYIDECEKELCSRIVNLLDELSPQSNSDKG